MTNQEYKDKNYDKVTIWIKKGKREEYKAAAAELGLGQMELFRIAVDEYIATHKGKDALQSSEP